jgi:hypothetical protein
MKLAVVVASIVLAAQPAFAREQFRGQYAQIDAQDRAWFRAQKSPQTGNSCCNEADGTYAEEDIREGHYWTRFMMHRITYPPAQEKDVPVDWMQVPDEVVIKQPNRHGAPTVWWYIDGQTQKVMIRCYAVGAKG